VVDVRLDFGETPAGRVQVHHGTREVPGAVAALGGRFFQLRLEHPLVAAHGDRLVVRRIAPPDTLGGGVVLDAHARKHGPSPRRRPASSAWLAASLENPPSRRRRGQTP
jgi:selenocysteine-specific elongation factor